MDREGTREPANARTGRRGPREWTNPATQQALCERAAAHAADVAADHFPTLPIGAIGWETSTRMQRSAGKAIYDPKSEDITIRLSWDAY